MRPDREIVPEPGAEWHGLAPAAALELSATPSQYRAALALAIARDAAEHGPTVEGELRPLRCLGGAWFVYHAHPRRLPGAVNEQVVAMSADVVARRLGHVPDRPIVFPLPLDSPAPSAGPTLDAEEPR